MNFSEWIINPTKGTLFIISVALILVSILNSVSFLGHSLAFDVSGMAGYAARFLFELAGWIGVVISLRDFVLDIKKEDLKKFIPMAIVFFGSVAIYSLGRQTKDALMYSITSNENVTVTKVFVLIGSVAYAIYQRKFTKNTSFSKLPFFAIVPIIGYLAFSTYFLMDSSFFPVKYMVGKIAHFIQPTSTPFFIPSPETIGSLTSIFPFLGRFFSLIGIWPVCLFYIFMEIWAVAVMTVYVWQFANQFVNKEERSRFYPVFMIVMQFATLIPSTFINAPIFEGMNNFRFAKVGILPFILLMVALIFFANKYFFSNNEDKVVLQKEGKKSVGFLEIFSIASKNKMFLLVACLGVYYGMCTVYYEQFWKAVVSNNSGDSMKNFMAVFNIWQSKLALILSFLGSSFFIKNLSWTMAAALTPVISLASGVIIYGFYIFSDPIGQFLAINPILAVCTLGAVMVAIFKSFKYVTFDTTKEYYISSQKDDDKKDIKDLEGVLNRIGKSGGSLLLTVIFSLFPSVSYSTGWFVMFLWISTGIMSVIWLYSDITLGEDLKKHNKDK